ncbi:MAG: YkgJ family cysteine cluster protein [Desulfobulbaceae bacterium]|uniref:YkgJ family cysteine cluster protein n=1 Tax=Candidatus Desulfobia pelagia TaxID=2841692 RepID=A0A8J6TGK2_9BACT|nr:YkgJ family cysteine cluster protein [Candidatus Desulfobia pelagia]
MSHDRKEILEGILEVYETWAEDQTFACEKGCASCCTQNVTMTAVEGEFLLNYIIEIGKQKWFAEKLQLWNGKEGNIPSVTHNTFAGNCLQGIETETPEHESQEEPCPFLEKNICTIYQARPFGCRCFASRTDCRKTGSAEQSDELVAINTVTMQVIEHLGQKEFWGNIYDVLLALCALPENRDIGQFLTDTDTLSRAQRRVLTAKPVPGFLIMPEEQERVGRFLNLLFNKEIQGKTIENILNNK